MINVYTDSKNAHDLWGARQASPNTTRSHMETKEIIYFDADSGEFGRPVRS